MERRDSKKGYRAFEYGVVKVMGDIELVRGNVEKVDRRQEGRGNGLQ